MDLGFVRRQRAAVPDLSALLARTAAAQGASPTARAQFRLDAHGATAPVANPLVSLFADAEVRFINRAAAFAVLPKATFRPRQPS